MKEENLNLYECSEALLKVSNSLREKNSEMSKSILSMAEEILDKIESEEFENDVFEGSKLLLKLSKSFEKKNKGLSDILLTIADVVLRECDVKNENTSYELTNVSQEQLDEKNVTNLVEKIKKVNCGESNCEKCNNENEIEIPSNIRNLVDKIRNSNEKKS